MVRTPLHQPPCGVHQMYLRPHRGRNLGPLQDPHHRRSHRMADTVPGDPNTGRHPQADGGSRGGPQGSGLLCPLHPATHPRGQPPGHGSTNAADGRATYVPHQHIPASSSHPTSSSNAPPLLTVRPHSATYHETQDPPPSPRITQRAQHRHGTHEHDRHRTHTRQHGHTASSHAPTPPSFHRYRQSPATACPLSVRQRLPQTALPCSPNHWVCLGAAHCPTHSPGCGDLNPHHRAQPPTPAAPPPRQPPQLLWATHWLPGGPCVDHCHCNGRHTPVPPQPAPTPQPGRLELAPCHILLALYVHHRGLHLPDPQPPAPGTAAPAPEGWAETAPEKVADHLRRTCRRFNSAFGRQKGAPYPHSAHLYPGPPALSHS